MNEIILKMFIIAAILNIENIQAFQFLLSRPSSTAFLISLPVLISYKGNPVIYPFILDSFTAALVMELIILDFNPVGGNIIPNGVIGSAVSTILIASGYSVSMSFFVGFLCAFLYSKLDFFMRTYRNKWNFIAEKEINMGIVKPGKWIFYSIALEFSISLIFLYFSFYFLKHILKFLSQYRYTIKSFDIAFYSTVFVGITALFFRLKSQVGKNG
jgi:hypothetical protein